MEQLSKKICELLDIKYDFLRGLSGLRVNGLSKLSSNVQKDL